MELFGEGSGDLTNEKFHPGWFLLQHHHATTFEDFKAGLAYLKRKVNSQKEGQLSFLKVIVGHCKEKRVLGKNLYLYWMVLIPFRLM